MSTLSKRLLTPQEYLALERKAEFRSEYYRGEMRPMPRTNYWHSLIKTNLACETGNQLDDTECEVLTSDMRVKVVATGLYTYPDMVVVSEKPQCEDDEDDTLLNPHVVVEVLSNASEEYDRGLKFRNYQQAPSIQEYVLVAHKRPLVQRFVRQADDSWVLTTFGDMAQTFDFATIPVHVAMAEIYRDVEFPDPGGR